MLRLALRSALAKKRRLFGTALSVMLGVAFLAGTLVFTDTIQRVFDDLFASIYDETDVYVRPSTEVDLGQGASLRGRMPESVLDTVAAVPGVRDAQPLVSGFAQIIDAHGKPIGNPGQGAPTFAMSYSLGPLSPWQLTMGSRAPEAGEIVIDQGSADRGDLRVGQQVTIVTQTGPHTFLLVGTARFGSVDSPGGASVSLLDLRTSQAVLTGGALELDAVMVDAEPGVSEDDLTRRVASVLPDGTEALTGTEITRENQDLMREGLGFVSTFLLVFAVIGLVVACFTIYNTFQIIVSQRIREMALLRSIGAARSQVLGAQLVEAVIVGIVASALGLVTGVLVARGLKALMEAVGIDIPGGATVFEARTAVVALAVGLVVTVGSAVVPSLRASRVPPLAAIRSVAIETGDHQGRRRLVQGGLLAAVGIAAFVAGLNDAGIIWVGIGALATLVGAFVLGPLVARPVARLVGGGVARVVGITGQLARENAARSPKRTARTGGALMVGVALVSAITIIAATARDWSRDVFESQFTGDFVASSTSVGFGGLSTDVAARLNELPEVDAAAGVRVGAAHDLDGTGDLTYMAIDPAVAGRVFDLGMVEGSIEDLGSDGILLEDGTASARGLQVGDTMDLGFLDGSTATLVVAGTYADDDMAGDYVVSHALHERSGADQFDFSVFIETAAGVSDEDAHAAIAAVTDDYANADLQSRSEYIDTQAAQVDQLVNLMYGLLALAVLIALVSIANSISLSIHERTHELGLLRAVGMTRRQTGSAVRWEAAIVALLGSSLGALLGVFFGWAISVALRAEGLAAFTVPVPALILIVGVSVVGGVLAAVRPAWRAAHLDVLRSIAAE